MLAVSGSAAAAQAAVAAPAAEAAKADNPRCPAPAAPTSYIVSSQVDVVALLPPPPLANSAQQQADVQVVLAAQRAARAAGTTARAIADTEITCARFKDVLGPELKSQAAAAALKFVDGAAGSATGMSGPPKNYWKRPRPYTQSSEVARLGDMAPDGKASSEENPRDPSCSAPTATATETPQSPEEVARQAAAKAESDKQRDNTSYPSGHAAFGAACGILLAEMIPEKRVELFARARQYGESRMIVGAHYQTDVEAGQLAGTIGAALLMQNASFQRQFFEAQAELRTALNYPVKLPDLEPNKGMFKDLETPSGGRGGRGGRSGRGGGAPPSGRGSP